MQKHSTRTKPNTQPKSDDDRARRCEELRHCAQLNGFTLPMPADVIVTWEDAGFVVDLATGEMWAEAEEEG